MDMHCKRRLLKTCSIIGSLLINHFSRPIVYWGNMSIYVMSYLHHQNSDIHVQNSQFFFYYNASWSLFMFFSERLTNFLKPRFIVLFGVAVYNCFFFGSVFLDSVSWSTYLLAFGILSGAGLGIFEGLILKHYVMAWAQRDRAFLTSLAVSSAATGAAILNEFMTLWVHPKNLAPDLEIGSIDIFTQEEVLSKVPSMFLVSGLANLSLQLIGLCLIKDGIPSVPNNSDPTTNNYDTFLTVESSEDPKENSTNESLLRFLVSPNFLRLWCIGFFLYTASYPVQLYYKTFGQSKIESDHFLTNLGTAMSISGIFSTVLWGIILDKLGIKLTLITMTSLLGIFCLAMYFTAIFNRWVYFVTAVIAYDIADALYLCLLAFSSTLFDKRHFNRNVALFNTAGVLGAFASSWVTKILLSHFSWFSVFVLSSVLSLAALLLTLTFQEL